MEGSCINDKTILFCGATFNAVTDVAILTLPMPIIWHLQAALPKRLALIGVFALGGVYVFGFEFLSSVLELTSYRACIAIFVAVQKIIYFDHNDPTYTSADVSIWTYIEINLSLICSCLPVTQALIHDFIVTPLSRRVQRWTTVHSSKDSTGGMSPQTGRLSFRNRVITKHTRISQTMTGLVKSEERHALRAMNKTPWQKPGSRAREADLDRDDQLSGRSWLSIDLEKAEKNHSMV